MNELIEALHSSRDNWIHAVRPLSSAEWRYRTADDSWNTAQCAEHIVVVENALFRQIEKGLAEGRLPDPERAAALAGKERMLRQRIPARLVKVKAPEKMVPTGRMESPSEFIREFQEVRKLTLDLATATGPAALETIIFPHFALGDLTGSQWLWFIALHADRHLIQAREALAVFANQ
jgi:uncharacterized damage-inducible protein DinB